MKMNEEIILDEDQKNQLEELSEQFKSVRDELSSIDKEKKALSSILKTMMQDFGVTKYISDSNISISMSTRQNISFDEDKLISLCKSWNIDGLVKKKEYVDMDVLERVLYNDTSLREQVKQVQIVKPDIVTLKCTQKKPLNE